MSDELITRFLTGDSAGDDESLLRWRDADAADDARFRRRNRVWLLLGRLGGRDRGHVPTAAELIARAGREGASVRRFPTTARPGGDRHRWPWRAAAAGIALLLALPHTPSPSPALGVVESATSAAGTQRLRLNDGTRVRVAPGGQLLVEPGTGRTVHFQGKAYFEVAPDRSRPFRIHTGGAEVEVLGTRFELRAGVGGTRVVVVEGRVALSAGEIRTEIAADQAGQVEADGSLRTQAMPDARSQLGWLDGVLVFQDVPLRRVAREIADHYATRVEVLDDELAARRVTAWLPEQSLDDALTAVCAAVDARCERLPGQVRMTLPP